MNGTRALRGITAAAAAAAAVIALGSTPASARLAPPPGTAGYRPPAAAPRELDAPRLEAAAAALAAHRLHIRHIAHAARVAALARAAEERAAEEKRAAEERAAAARAARQQAARSPASAPATVTVQAAVTGNPRQEAAAMLGSFGWGQDQMPCLDQLWDRESGWNPYAENPSTGAYGIPQALPGSKMSSAGADWATSAATQIRWGLGYIAGQYGSPCAAWGHSEADGWY